MLTYRVRCPIVEVPYINHNGCGWERDTENEAQCSWSDNDRYEAISRVMVETRAQSLAQYSHHPQVSRMDLVLHHDASAIDVYVAIEGNCDPATLDAIRADIQGQMSDGWGEGFEQKNFDLKSGDEKLEFAIDYSRIGAMEPYDPQSMPSLDWIAACCDIERAKERLAALPRP